MSSASQTLLNRAAIVAQALLIADRDGLAAVSMRRVGAELGYSGMSLYGYVANKEELLELLVDHVLGTVPEIDRSIPWGDAVVEFFTALNATLLDHPAVARLASEQPTQGPHTRRHAQLVLGVLRSGGLSDQLAVEAFVALSCYTIGAALYSAGRAEASDTDWISFGAPTDATAEDTEPLLAHLATRTSAARFRSGVEHLVRGYGSAGPVSRGVFR